jgi:hypothetical protein
VDDLVFDNLHPNGITMEMWLADFDAIGGVKLQRVEEF